MRGGGLKIWEMYRKESQLEDVTWAFFVLEGVEADDQQFFQS